VPKSFYSHTEGSEGNISIDANHTKFMYIPSWPYYMRRRVSIDTSARALPVLLSSICHGSPIIISFLCHKFLAFIRLSRIMAWATTPTSCPALWGYPASSALWWWSYKRKIDIHRLVQQFRPMRAINCSSSFIQCWVLNQSIPLS